MAAVNSDARLRAQKKCASVRGMESVIANHVARVRAWLKEPPVSWREIARRAHLSDATVRDVRDGQPATDDTLAALERVMQQLREESAA